MGHSKVYGLQSEESAAVIPGAGMDMIRCHDCGFLQNKTARKTGGTANWI
jgi:hypothetical protein